MKPNFTQEVSEVEKGGVIQSAKWQCNMELAREGLLKSFVQRSDSSVQIQRSNNYRLGLSEFKDFSRSRFRYFEI